MKWRDCVVIYIDLIGLKERTRAAKRRASFVMRTFHMLIAEEFKSGLPAIDHAYIWNDSLLLLAYVDGSTEAYRACLKDADALKRKIDKNTRSYAIAVKGQTFPLLMAGAESTNEMERVTILRTSSYAMANCFEIEKWAHLRNLRYSWYLDGRIVKRINISGFHKALSLRLLPQNRSRRVYLYHDYLWTGPA